MITGLSGSGKSSLAFDTIYAEGQRRYVESLSAYARQFLGLMEKPDVDHIDGLSPAISIDQKGVSKNPRSTVATVTEIYDYLRLLFARIGVPHCPHCGQVIKRQTVQQIVDAILAEPAGTRALLLAPLVRHKRGEHVQIFEGVRKAGFVRVRVDGAVRDIEESFALERNKWHDIDVVVDRLVIPALDDEDYDGTRQRVSDSVEQALKLGEGILLLAPEGRAEVTFSERYACPNTSHPPYSVGEIEPRNFSFNSPHGACPACTGLGIQMELDPGLVVPNKKLSINEGGIIPYARMSTSMSWYRRRLAALADAFGYSLDTPLQDLTEAQWSALMHGTEGETINVAYQTTRGRMRNFEISWEGVLTNLARRYRESESEWVRGDIEKYMVAIPCAACHGARLKPEMLAVTIEDRSIVDVARMSVSDASGWTERLRSEATPLSGRDRQIGRQVLQEIAGRLNFLSDVGLEYLTLDRASATLSGGEGQRIRLATQIGSALMGVLYVCDEPSIGLHPVDNERLIRTLTRLRDLGNTVIVVEHDEAMMRAADWLIDLGPGAGEHGGEVIATGTPAEVMAEPRSLTGQYLSGTRAIPIPRRAPSRQRRVARRPGRDGEQPQGHRCCLPARLLHRRDRRLRLGQVVARQRDPRASALAHELHGARERAGAHTTFEGIEHVDKVVRIDQSPIGRTPRSNPATYTGLFTVVRDLFAAVPESRARGYGAGTLLLQRKGRPLRGVHRATATTRSRCSSSRT